MKRLFSILLLLSLILAPALAQAPRPPAVRPQFLLTVTANAPNFTVFVNGAAQKGSSFPLNAGGNYQIKVTAPGYKDYSVAITLTNNLTLPVTLEPAGMTVSIAATNVTGADVFINGSPMGKTPLQTSLAPGGYTLSIRAPGYFDYTQNFTVSGPLAINAALQPLTYQLAVETPGVSGAQVFINGSAVGQAPLALNLAGGSYAVLVKAAGYFDYSQTVNLAGPVSVQARLQPALATFQINLPTKLVNADLKGEHWNQIRVFVDGAPIQGFSGQLTPGRHVIRVTSGGLQAEVAGDFVAGKAYGIEPGFTITVK